MMKSWFGFLLMMCLFSLTPVSAQESREAFLAGLRAAIQNPKNWIDVYQRTQQPEFAAIIKEAAQSGDQTLVKELLGAAIGENRQQHPPLVIAVIHRDIEIIRAVLDMGADIESANNEKRTALHHAASDEERPRILALLLERGANPNARSFVGTTPLMIAAEAGATRNLKALLMAGAEVNARNNDGETALMHAVQANASEAVRVLLQSGANPRLKDERGRTAAEWLTDVTLQNHAPQSTDGRFFTGEGQNDAEEQTRAHRKSIARLLEQVKSPPLRALALSADGKILASGDANGEVQLWDPATGIRKATLTPNENVLSVGVSPNGAQILVGCKNKPVQVWENQGSQYRQTRTLPVQSAQSFVYFPDGKTVAVGEWGSGTIHLFEAATGKRQSRLWEASNGIATMAFSPIGKRLLTGGASAKLWDVRQGSPRLAPEGRFSVRGDVQPPDAVIWSAGFDGEYVSGVAFASHGMLAAGTAGIGSNSGGKTLKIWDAVNGKVRRKMIATGLTCVAFLPGNQTILTGDDQGFLTLWNVTNGKTIFQTRLAQAPIWNVVPIPRTSLVAVGREDGGLVLWDTQKRAVKRTLIAPVSPSVAGKTNTTPLPLSPKSQD